MMEWIFWPTRVSYANDPVGTVLVGAVALLFGVGLGARLPRGKLRTALWGLPLFPLAAELLASPAYSREDWFLSVRLAFALDGLAAMALALWLGYALGTLFRREMPRQKGKRGEAGCCFFPAWPWRRWDSGCGGGRRMPAGCWSPGKPRSMTPRRSTWPTSASAGRRL